ncbi:MAG: Ppx/GppA family phosphatase [Ignavibacteriae bacterium]|nr:Ppx/GppA family phosphatase [Ignavibacteriota bacterium]
MRIGAIDIGTNTILLLIADVQADGSLSVVRDEHAIARLGKGVDEHRRVLPATFDRAVEFLRPYQAILNKERVDTVTVCATSFLRDALNKQEFIDHVKKHVGYDVRVLSGEEEATLTYLGAISEFYSPGSSQRFAVIDIGGGSTELTFGTDINVSRRKSLDIGSVRLTERVLKSSPPSRAALDNASQLIRQQVQSFPHPSQSARLIGVAGTLTTLAAMDLRLAQYDRTAVSGHVLHLKTIRTIFDELSVQSLDEIKAHPQILPERADILLAGVLILLETLEVFGRDEITASDRGLRYGMILEKIASLT